MHPLPAGLYTAAQVRALDRRAIEHGGIPGYELMTRAGHATLNALRRRWPAARSIAVCCGPGNNGGDGYVIARIARAQGLRVHAMAIANPAELQGDARRACDEFAASGGDCEPWQPQLLTAVDVVVDAVLGTGLSRDVTGLAATCIKAINAAGRPVVAVDIPSGLHADTGHVLGCTVRADLTVTFIGRKVGCYVGVGPDNTGTIVFDGLGVTTVDFEQEPVLRLLDDSVVAAALPRRARTAHKGRHGHVLVIGGAAGMGGAVRLAGEAALRAGAGLVTVATDVGSLQALSARPELMSHVLTGPGDLAPVIARATVIALGPGLGQSPWAQDILAAALAAQKPTDRGCGRAQPAGARTGTAACRLGADPAPGRGRAIARHHRRRRAGRPVRRGARTAGPLRRLGGAKGRGFHRAGRTRYRLVVRSGQSRHGRSRHG